MKRWRSFCSERPPGGRKSRQWDPKDLQLLNQERTLLGPGEFTKLAQANIPADLADEFADALKASIQQWQEPAQRHTAGGVVPGRSFLRWAGRPGCPGIGAATRLLLLTSI